MEYPSDTACIVSTEVHKMDLFRRLGKNVLASMRVTFQQVLAG